jgi:hypothetical protein
VVTPWPASAAQISSSAAGFSADFCAGWAEGHRVALALEPPLCVDAFGQALRAPGALAAETPFPKLGVKVVEKLERTFTEDQLREARAAVGLLNMGSSDMGRKAFQDVLEGKQAMTEVLGEGTRHTATYHAVRAPEILASIRNDREIKKDTEAKLVGFLDDFAKSFG